MPVTDHIYYDRTYPKTNLIQGGGVQDEAPSVWFKDFVFSGNGSTEGGGEGEAVGGAEGAAHVRNHQLRHAPHKGFNTLVKTESLGTVTAADADREQLMGWYERVYNRLSKLSTNKFRTQKICLTASGTSWKLTPSKHRIFSLHLKGAPAANSWCTLNSVYCPSLNFPVVVLFSPTME